MRMNILDKILYKVLNESPDYIISQKKGWHDKDAIAFGYYKDKLYIKKGTHAGLKSYYHLPIRSSPRSGFEYPGRLWVDAKLISFWKYPENKVELFKILNDFKKAYKSQGKDISFDNSWKIEIIDSSIDKDTLDVNDDLFFIELEKKGLTNIISINDYTGSDDVNNSELNTDHTQSPIFKDKTKDAKDYHNHHQNKIDANRDQRLILPGIGEIIKQSLKQSLKNI